MLNRATLMGHVGQDPTVKSTESGRKVASFSLATSERWKDKTTGDMKEATEWHRIVVWNESLVKLVEQYIRKGQQLFVEGPLRTRKYTDNTGVERYTTEIVLSGFDGQIKMLGKKDSGANPNSSLGSATPPDEGKGQRDFGRTGGPDDEIPF